MQNFVLLVVIVSAFFFFESVAAVCGDSTCQPHVGETRASCTDCRCGDGICDFSEYYTICPSDCPSSCGDLVCSSSENVHNCPLDCDSGYASCGNGICDIGETNKSCVHDCDGVKSGHDIFYVLYVSDPQHPNYLYTCSVTVYDDKVQTVFDEYEMAVVASGKTVPNAGTYYIDVDCDNNATASTWLSIESGHLSSQVFTLSAVSTCSPQCSGRNCGSDGCGGSCGTCFEGQICSNGVCQGTCTANCNTGRIKKTSVTLQFGGMIPTPSCCSSTA